MAMGNHMKPPYIYLVDDCSMLFHILPYLPMNSWGFPLLDTKLDVSNAKLAKKYKDAGVSEVTNCLIDLIATWAPTGP